MEIHPIPPPMSFLPYTILLLKGSADEDDSIEYSSLLSPSHLVIRVPVLDFAYHRSPSHPSSPISLYLASSKRAVLGLDLKALDRDARWAVVGEQTERAVKGLLGGGEVLRADCARELIERLREGGIGRGDVVRGRDGGGRDDVVRGSCGVVRGMDGGEEGNVVRLEGDMDGVKGSDDVVNGNVVRLEGEMNVVKGSHDVEKGNVVGLEGVMNVGKGSDDVVDGNVVRLEGEINVVKGTDDVVNGNVVRLDHKMDVVKGSDVVVNENVVRLDHKMDVVKGSDVVEKGNLVSLEEEMDVVKGSNDVVNRNIVRLQEERDDVKESDDVVKGNYVKESDDVVSGNVVMTRGSDFVKGNIARIEERIDVVIGNDDELIGSDIVKMNVAMAEGTDVVKSNVVSGNVGMPVRGRDVVNAIDDDVKGRNVVKRNVGMTKGSNVVNGNVVMSDSTARDLKRKEMHEALEVNDRARELDAKVIDGVCDVLKDDNEKSYIVKMNEAKRNDGNEVNVSKTGSQLGNDMIKNDRMKQAEQTESTKKHMRFSGEIRKVIFFCGNIKKPDLPEYFKSLPNVEFQEICMYDTIPKSHIELPLCEKRILAFFSPSGCKAVMDGSGIRSDDLVIAIGPTTAQALAGRADAVAARPSPKGLFDAINEAIAKNT